MFMLKHQGQGVPKTKGVKQGHIWDWHHILGMSFTFGLYQSWGQRQKLT